MRGEDGEDGEDGDFGMNNIRGRCSNDDDDDDYHIVYYYYTTHPTRPPGIRGTGRNELRPPPAHAHYVLHTHGR